MSTLTAANTYSGNTLISAGTLALGSGLALPNSTFDTSSSGVLSFGSLTAATFGGITRRQPGPGQYCLAPVALSVGRRQTTAYSGVLSDGAATGGSLTKIGGGLLTSRPPTPIPA